MAKLKLGVLISGRGSNLGALIAACRKADFPAEIRLVISNAADAPGLDHAARAGIATAVVDHRGFADRESFDSDIDAALAGAAVDLVCLAGFMRILGPDFVTRWRNRVINIHPSLLPAFKGLNVHERVLDAGALITGCTVHYVRPEMDAGPILAQAAVPVLPGDTAESLSRRVLKAEHRIYPAAVRLIAEGRARVSGGRVTFRRAATATGSLINPPAG